MAAESVLALGVILLDRHGRITTWNAGATRMFGWTAPEMAGQTLARCCEPQGVIDRLADQALATAAQQGSYQGESICMRKDAGRFRTCLGLTALRNLSGEVGGYTVSLQDLSDRQDPAATLRQAHRHVAIAMLSQAALSGADPRMLIEHAATFMSKRQVDYCGLLVSRTMARPSLTRRGMAGALIRCATSVAGRGWHPPTAGLGFGRPDHHPRSRPQPRTRARRVPARTSHGRVPAGANARRGQALRAPRRVHPGSGRFHRGRPGLPAGHWRSAGQRPRPPGKEADNAKLAAFPRHNPNPVFELSANGDLTYCNAAASALARSMGLPRPADLLPSTVPHLVRECLGDGRSREGFQTQHGERTIDWAIYPVPAIQRAHLYAEEVTTRLSLEAQLRQSQKMQAIGQLRLRRGA